MIGIFLILLFVFVLSLITYIIVISPFILLKPFRKKSSYFKNKNIITDPGYYGIRYENISFKSFDEKCMRGWILIPTYSKATIIFLHGISDARYSHLQFMKNFIKKGYKVVMFDARAHGESEGDFCTYGYYEKKDVLYAIKYLERNKYISEDSFIGLMGVSLGGAVTLQSLNVDKRIKFAITEAAFSNFQSTMNDYRSRGILKLTRFCSRLVEKRIERIGNFKISDIMPSKELVKYQGKVLLIHGDKDEKIDIKYHKELMENANNFESLVVKGAGHNNLRDIGGKEYIEKILDFADNIVPGNYTMEK